MKLSRLFSSREVDDFARELARELSERYPEPPPGREDTRAARRRVRATEEIYRRARAFRTERGLGVYGKARLSNSFQWALKDFGYSEAFIEDVTKGLVVSISR